MLLGSGLLLATLCHAAPPVEPSSERRAVLLHWLRDDCGACHGMTLAGGLGSPLTAAALADKPAEGGRDAVIRSLGNGHAAVAAIYLRGRSPLAD